MVTVITNCSDICITPKSSLVDCLYEERDSENDVYYKAPLQIYMRRTLVQSNLIFSNIISFGYN